jgi:predicted RNA binding protein YcfA (HicA-like mRNA interferase family)
VTARQVIRRIRDLADTAAKVHQVGSHERWQVNGHCKITIPVHGGDIPPGTLSSIQRQGAHCLGEAWLK